jgi:hypothetical protein
MFIWYGGSLPAIRHFILYGRGWPVSADFLNREMA